MLKHMRVRFELLTDIDRWSCSSSAVYAEANNKYMCSYDPSKPTWYLMYCNVNNLYGWMTCQPFPYAKFRWIENAANFDVSVIASNSSTSYILEVDLEYPQHLHGRHTDLPFYPMHNKSAIARINRLRCCTINSVTH